MQKAIDLIANLVPIKLGLLIKKHSMLISYLAVGGLNTLFGYSIFALLIFMGIHYSLSVLISSVLGILFNFRTYGSLVFRDKSWKKLWKFFLVYLFLYVLNVSLIYIFSKFIENVYISGFLALAFVVPGSFILNRRFVYETH